MTFDFKVQFVPHGKHSTFVVKCTNLILYWAIFGVCSEVQTKFITVLCGGEFLNVKFGGT